MPTRWHPWDAPSCLHLPWAVERGMVDIIRPGSVRIETVHISSVNWWDMRDAPIRWRVSKGRGDYPPGSA